MENKQFKTYKKKDGDKFLAHIKSDGKHLCQWQYKEGCFLMWVNGILSKLEGETQYVYINGRGWVAI